MRHFLFRLSLMTLSSVATVAALGSAHATPVYLHVDSRFPSGHHPRKWLESKTRGVQFQEWHRIETKDAKDAKAYGWLPEDHLVTPLKLAAMARVEEDTPARTEKDMDALEGTTLPKGTKVLILGTSGSWVRVKPLPASENGDTWLPSSSLLADLSAPAPKAFLPAPAVVYILPGLNSRVQTRLKDPRFVQVLKTKKDWLEVRLSSVTGLANTGWVRKADAVTLQDLGTVGARPIFDLAPLRSAPMPYADLVRSLSASTPLRILTHRSLRWGRASIKDIGEIWWPMAEEVEDAQLALLRERISTGQLFKRKIFDMASSPAIPALKFVSAQGVFRTNDGKEWTRIPMFQDKNYPIAVAGGGSVFVGPYMSDDHGETFQQWIRWDLLVSKLRHVSHSKGMRILDVKPQDAAARRVVLKLNVGTGQPVSVVTEDQGLSWRLLSRN
jgi:hypothetical protein